MEPIFLELDDVLDIHRDQIQNYGGSEGLRDLGLLESALAMPQAGFGDQFFHADLYEMAAAYLFHLVSNHPFLDGNKRTGVAAAYAFLRFNGIVLAPPNQSFEKVVLRVAQGQVDKAEIAAFFRKHSRKARD